MTKFTWPFVGIIGLGLGFVVAIFGLIPNDMPEARSALLGVIMTGIGGIVTAAVGILGHQIEQTNHKVDQVVRNTNGNMSQLIASKTTTDAVSRETTAPEEAA